MPKLTTTATQTTEVDIVPEIAATLKICVDLYNDLKVQAEDLEVSMNMAKRDIMVAMIEAGISSIRVGETPVALVKGTSTKMDKLKFVELGGSLEMLKNASVTKPKKAYIQIGAEKGDPHVD